ncbi:hypothetical protein D3C73_456190 [compost metagenome]
MSSFYVYYYFSIESVRQPKEQENSNNDSVSYFIVKYDRPCLHINFREKQKNVGEEIRSCQNMKNPNNHPMTR